MMSDQTNDLAKALSKAQGEMKAAVYNKINPHFKNKYADMAAVIDAIRKPFADNGLAWTQAIERNELGMFLVTRLHFGEQWISSNHPLPNGGVTPQAFGSALTYARRYSLSALCGIAADEDDDAETTRTIPTGSFPGYNEMLTRLQLLISAHGSKELQEKAKEALEKRENPHVTKPEDIIEHDLEYDAEGNPVDNIPVGQDGLKPMSKAMARPEYAKLLSDIRSYFDLEQLTNWGKTNANRVATLPGDWQTILRDEFRSKQIELGWKQKS